MPEWHNKANPSWFGFPLIVRDKLPFNRNEIATYLESRKVATRNFFAGNVLRQPAYLDKVYRTISNLKNSDFMMTSGFWIGVYPGINTEKSTYVIDTFEQFFNKYK